MQLILIALSTVTPSKHKLPTLAVHTHHDEATADVLYDRHCSTERRIRAGANAMSQNHIPPAYSTERANTMS